jgi:hypothetical protein
LLFARFVSGIGRYHAETPGSAWIMYDRYADPIGVSEVRHRIDVFPESLAAG